MSNLTDHAHRELTLAGWLSDDDEQSGVALLNAVRAFSQGGWSGGSAPFGIAILSDLLQFKALTPLTDDPAEWQEVSLTGDWQSRRRPDAFSEDGGKTYRLQSEAKVRYDRWPWLLWRLRLRDKPVGFQRGSDFRKSKLHHSVHKET